MPSARNGNTRINYDMVGKGPVIVMHHGFFGTLQDWYEYGYVEALVDRFRILLIDARGHGQSDKPVNQSSYSIRQHAQDVLAVLEHLSVDTFRYLGFSFGARVGFTVSQLVPERLLQCACLAGHPLYAKVDQLRQGILKMHEWVAAQNFSQWQNARLFDNNADALTAAAAYDRPDHSAALGETLIPFLLVVGDNDVDRKKVLLTAALIPNCRLVVLDRIGHFGILKHSEMVVPHLRSFFKTNKEPIERL